MDDFNKYSIGSFCGQINCVPKVNDVLGRFKFPLHQHILGIYECVLGEYDLTSFQSNVLYDLFNAFNEIQELIDPEKLSFKHMMNADDELFLYRRSSLGLTNIVIDEEELITYSFIPKSGENELEFYNKEELDFESIALKFFTR